MTESSAQINEEKSILKWAGLAGVAGVITAVLSLIINATLVPIFVPTQSGCGPACNVDASLPDFPTVKASIVAANAFYFLSILLFAILFLGLYRALRVGGSLGPALFGTGLSNGTRATWCWSSSICRLRPSFGGLPRCGLDVAGAGDSRPSLARGSSHVQAIFNATDTVGGYLLAAGLIMFGAAMFQNSSFGRRLGLATIVLSTLAVAGISLVSVALDNPNDFFFVILVLVLPLVLGLKIYSLSRAARIPG